MLSAFQYLAILLILTCTLGCKGETTAPRSGPPAPEHPEEAPAEAPASTSARDEVAVEEIATLNVPGLPYDASISILAFSPDGTWLASASSEDNDPGVSVLVWDVAKRTLQATLAHGRGPIMKGVAFSPDGKKLATASMSGLVKIWEVGSWKELAQIQFQGGLLLSVAFDPKTISVALGGTTRTVPPKGAVKLFDTGTKQLQKSVTLEAGAVRSLEFSPDGAVLAIGTGSGRGQPNPQGKLELFDVATGKLEPSVVADRSDVSAIRYSPDGKTLATGGGPQAKLWEAVTLKARGTLKAHRWGVSSIAYSTDGTLLAGADMDSIILWDVASGAEVADASKPLKGSRCVAFSPKDGILATGGVEGSHEIRLWKVTPKKRKE